jgi:23S rRNA (cytosine1962-C5)-methyltransferase
VVNVDSSAQALALARRNLALNGFIVHDEEFIEADVFGLLRKYRAEGRAFDVIILDPPKFVHTAGQVEKAARAYKDLNLVAMQILRPGGLLATFSCSGLVSPDLFQKIVFGASVDAARDAQIVEKLSQASDHPILLSFPEAEYLKGLVCRVF